MEVEFNPDKPTTKVVWIGNPPHVEVVTKSKKGNQWELASLTFETGQETINIKVDKDQGRWLAALLSELSVHNMKGYTLQEVRHHYENAGLSDFDLFWDNKPVNQLYKAGLLKL